LLSTELEYHTTSLCELAACKIQLDAGPPLIVCSVYRPPNVEAIFLENLCAVLRDIVECNPDSVVWIAGDANFPNIDWNSYSIIGYNYPTHLCETFLSFIQDCGLTQTVNFVTRSENTLHIFLNRPSLVSCFKPLAGISDHDIVFVESTVEAQRSSNPSDQCYKLWNRADNKAIEDYVTSFV